MGIAVVVPSDKIWEMLEIPEFANYRKQKAIDLAGGDSPTPD
jgi:hypothetical protein